YRLSSYLFFFTALATTEIYTLSLHDALPISPGRSGFGYGGAVRVDSGTDVAGSPGTFRWAGYGTTFFWIDPRTDLIAMVWTQYRSEEHTSELQSPCNLVCRLLLEKKKKNVHT